MKANIRKDKQPTSARRKLVPAVAMLTTSAIMLSTATYAWFTMSREVEVTGLNMTATVPEDLQISLGTLGTTSSNVATESDKLSLANSTGVLVESSTDSTASDGKVKAPTNSWDWSNTADISAYYKFGKLMPASSTTGETIYYTNDATGVGRTVSDVAKYFAANSKLSALVSGGTTEVSSDNDSAKTTLHAITSSEDTWSGYSKATAWDKTNDDGYYIDIPIWLRSSATEDINISVAGYVLPGTTDGTSGKAETDLELYRAVRVAILNGDTAGIKSTTTSSASTVTEGSACTTNNILPLADAWDKTNSGTTTADGTGITKYTSIVGISNPYTGTSILDSKIYDERMSYTNSTTPTSGSLWGVSSITSYTQDEVNADKTSHISTSDNKAVYSTYTAYSSSTAIATVTANESTDDYGTPKKLIIRVWLDGEDEECWNDNAGQDWAISLKFTKVDIPVSN